MCVCERERERERERAVMDASTEVKKWSQGHHAVTELRTINNITLTNPECIFKFYYMHNIFFSLQENTHYTVLYRFG